MFQYNGLSIRAVEEKDLHFLQELRNDPDTWYFLSDIRMLTPQTQASWHKNITQDKSRQYYIVTDNDSNQEIGMIRCDEIDHLNRSMRVGADVVKVHRGQGYGTKIYRLLLKYCFDFLNMNRVWLEVLDINKVGHRLYTNVGFKEEGSMRQAIYRDGQYRDYIVMSILREEYYASL